MYMLFWLTSFTQHNCLQRLIHVVVCINNSLLLLLNRFHYRDKPQLVYLVDGHWIVSILAMPKKTTARSIRAEGFG